MIVYDSVEAFAEVESAWNDLALKAPSPYLTHEWYLAWWRAFGEGNAFVVAGLDREGSVVAGAALIRRSARFLAAAANEHTGDWDVVAADDAARHRLWRQITTLPATRLELRGVPGPGDSAATASEALAEGGFHVATLRHELSPYLDLPPTWEELLGTISAKQRSNLRRYTKRLDEEGEFEFKTMTDPDSDHALDRFFEVEASGWKGAEGTAIRQDRGARRHYTEFARAAAAKGWLRLHLLELDDVTIAATYSCVIGDTAFLLKSGYDERYRHLAPGIVLRAETLRRAISEGLSRYEFLGKANEHKRHWAPKLRERSVVMAYRGSARPVYLYRHLARPLARRIRDRIRPGAGSA